MESVHSSDLAVADVSAIDVVYNASYILWVIYKREGMALREAIPVSRDDYLLNASWGVRGH